LAQSKIGATSGTVNFIFGADNVVTGLTVGNNFTPLVWNNGKSGFNPLGCSAASPTIAGNTRATYNNCVSTVSFDAANLAGDGGGTPRMAHLVKRLCSSRTPDDFEIV
jgi:hypothetical protein